MLNSLMALDTLTASQGGLCALVGPECCVHIPDTQHDVSQALPALAEETWNIEQLTEAHDKNGGPP